MEVKIAIDEFEEYYNHQRPHESLGNLNPMQYKSKTLGCEVF